MPAEIGSFKKIERTEGEKAVVDFIGNIPVDAMTKPDSTLEEQVKSIENELHKVEKSSEVTYEERVKKHGLSTDEALNIVNAMFDDNYYEKEYKLTSNYAVTFRTRSTSDQDRVLKQLELDNFQYPASVAQLVAKYNLAVSLQEFVSPKFKQMDFRSKSFDAKLKFISSLPETIFRLLAKKLSSFDEMVMDVLDDGAIENF